MEQAGFVWPTATTRGTANQHGSRPPVAGISPAHNNMLDHLYSMGRDNAVKEGDDTGFAWPTAGATGAEGFLPSPDSAEAAKRGGSPFYGQEDKRSRLY
jgi:hypothetical protein